MQIHHIGYLVEELEAARQEFELLGYETILEEVRDEIRRIAVSYLKKDGYVIELISALSDNSFLQPLLKRYRNSPYHMCYEVKNIKDAIQHLMDQGNYYLIVDPYEIPIEARLVMKNSMVAFLLNSHIGIIELSGNES